MPNMKWSQLNKNQLGQYAEYYAKMEFTSYGYDVYTSEIDDHGVDFVVRDIGKRGFFEIQVKSIRPGSPIYIEKDKISLDEHHLVCLLYFKDNELPEVYIIPATVWKNPNAVFVERNYDKPEQKSKPEWGINYSAKNSHLLEKYKSENFFQCDKNSINANNKKWLVRVNATKYNLFGGVRKCGNTIPWYFDCVKDKVKKNDEVYLYFTDSEPNEGRKYSVGNIDDAYKRIVFRGIITETNVSSEFGNYDSEFWDDKEQEEQHKNKHSFLVLIHIEEFMYDKNIRYSDLELKDARSSVTEILNISL